MSEISVIIPAYNAGAFLPDTLGSVLAQTWQDFEVIVVDDGSKDDTAKVVQPYLADSRMRYISKPNGGVSTARNTGARAATGTYLAFLDADDLLAPSALEILHNRVEETGASWAIVSFIKLTGQKIALRRAGVPEGPLLLAILKDYFVNRSLFYRREDFLAVGMFDEGLPIREDWDLDIRMVLAGKPFVVIDEPLYIYRRTEGSLCTGSPRKFWSSHEDLMRKHHRRLANAGDRAVARLYAENLWELAQRYVYEFRDYGSALRCILQSIRYDLNLARLLRPVIHHVRAAVRARPEPVVAAPSPWVDLTEAEYLEATGIPVRAGSAAARHVV